MGSTFLSSGSPGARLNLALLDSAYFCHVIPLPFYYMDFYGGDLGGHEKGETGLLQSPRALSFRSVVVVWILTSGDY
jgi:hypothetical protein